MPLPCFEQGRTYIIHECGMCSLPTAFCAYRHKRKQRKQVLKSYLKGVMNGHSSLPVNVWKSEYAKLTAEQKALNGQYLALKDEVKESEQIRKSVHSIIRQEQREQQPHKVREDVDR